ncbi:MAG: tetratricopeptide repeat protein [Desulfobaccales bacterium]
MDILYAIIDLAHKNLTDILTCLWIIWVGGVMVGVITCTVSAYLNRRTISRLTRQKYAPPGAPREEGADDFELDLDHLKDTLIRRQAALREDCERMRLDFDLQAVLENFRGRIATKLANLSATHHEILDCHQNIYRLLNDFKDLVAPDQLSLARMALKFGETGKATALLHRARFLINQRLAETAGSQLTAARDKKLAARAAFLLGQLEETNFNYFTAAQYYQQAADLWPSNLTYLKAAAELSYVFGEFHETEYMLEQVLRIQQKLLGPEHLDLAQTLNNLGVLRHTQGRYAEAEAFYLWALEICDGHRNSRAPEVINLWQNYAIFLQETGRRREADAMKTRAAMA